MDGTRIDGAGQVAVRVPPGTLAAVARRLGRVVARAIPLVLAPALAVVGLAWLASTVGVLPLLGGLAIGMGLFSVLIAWSLVRA